MKPISRFCFAHLYKLFKNTISYGQAHEPTYMYVLFSRLFKSNWNVPKNNWPIIRRCNMHIPMKDVKCQYLSKTTFWQHHVLVKKYMYIGNRHQRQWWICSSVWATWQCLMGLIRQAARAGSRSWDDAPLDVNGPVTSFPWLATPWPSGSATQLSQCRVWPR